LSQTRLDFRQTFAVVFERNTCYRISFHDDDDNDDDVAAINPRKCVNEHSFMTQQALFVISGYGAPHVAPLKKMWANKDPAVD